MSKSIMKVLFLLLAMVSQQVFACKCQPKTIEQVDVAAIGKVIRVKEVTREHRFSKHLLALVEIEECLKGDCNFIYVTAFEGIGACGIGLEKGGTFLFQLDNSKGAIEHYGLKNYVGLCSGSRRVSSE